MALFQAPGGAVAADPMWSITEPEWGPHARQAPRQDDAALAERNEGRKTGNPEASSFFIICARYFNTHYEKTTSMKQKL